MTHTSTKQDSNGYCQDASIVVRVQGGAHDGKTISIDLMLLRLASEELLNKFALKARRGKINATAEFVAALSEKLIALGVPCTPAIALHAWKAMMTHLAEVEKKTKESPDSATTTDSTSED